MTSPHCFRVAAILVAVLAVATTAFNLLPFHGSWDGVMVSAYTVLGAVAVAYGIRRYRPSGVTWWLLLACALLSAASTVAWWWPVFAGGDAPLASPSPADIGWLVGDQLIAAAMLTWLMRRERPLWVGLDILTLVVGVGVVAAVTTIAPDFATSVVPLDMRVTQVVYVVSDVVLLSVAVRLLLAPRPRPLAAWLLAGCAIGIVSSDFAWNWLTISGQYVPGAWADTGWDLAPLLLGLAALHPSMRRLTRPERQEDPRLRPLGVVLLGAALLVVPVIAGLHYTLGLLPQLDEAPWLGAVAAAGGIVLAALVVARLRLLLSRAQGLADALAVALDDRARELELSEASYRRLVEQLPGVVYELAPAETGQPGAVIYASPQTQHLLGRAPQDCLGPLECLLAGVHPEDRRDAIAALMPTAPDGNARSAEFRFVRPDGTPLWLRSQSAAVGGDGEAGLVQGFLFDVSEAKRAEAERDRMELDLRLAQKLEAVGQLAAGIAHEINTPIQFVGDTVRFLDEAVADLLRLTGVYGELRDAARADDIGPGLLERVRAAEDAADLAYLQERVPAAFERGVDGIRRVARIVGAMREFAHPPTTERAPVDLNHAVHTTLVVASNAYKYVADVRTDLGDLPAVLCNGGDINQVLLNLIVNAAHAIEDTGQRGLITVSTRTEGDDVTVSVSDTGAGIPSDVAARIYDPFYTTKQVGRGTGQGLAIARAIVVERHGGQITFETDPGRGTTFHVRLPVSPEPQRLHQREVVA